MLNLHQTPLKQVSHRLGNLLDPLPQLPNPLPLRPHPPRDPLDEIFQEAITPDMVGLCHLVVDSITIRLGDGEVIGLRRGLQSRIDSTPRENGLLRKMTLVWLGSELLPLRGRKRPEKSGRQGKDKRNKKGYNMLDKLKLRPESKRPINVWTQRINVWLKRIKINSDDTSITILHIL